MVMTNKLDILLFAIIILFSCGTEIQKHNSVSVADLSQKVQTVLTDKASTWEDVTEAVNPLIEEITQAATDEKDLERRMMGQEFGYKTIKLTINKYIDLMSEGHDVASDELDLMTDKIQEAINVWFYDNSSERPYLWRDQYYVSNKSGNNQVNGYFHIMVFLPTTNNPNPSLLIFYPDTAEGMPAIIFKANAEEEINDDDDLIMLDNWTAKNESQEDIPMYAFAGTDVVQEMLTNATMYLLFRSGNNPDGEPGETEVARIPLATFQEQWKIH